MTDTDTGWWDWRNQQDAAWLAFSAQMQILVKSTSEELEAIRKAQERANENLLRETPRLIRINTSLVIPAGGLGVATFNLSGPDQGHYWYVRKLSVGGLTPITAALGRCDVFVSASDLSAVTNLGQVGLADWADQATSLPLIAPYTRGELSLQGKERLWLIFSGATAGQEYVGNAIVEDYQEPIPNDLS